MLWEWDLRKMLRLVIPRLDYIVIPRLDYIVIPRLDYIVIPRLDYIVIPRLDYIVIPRLDRGIQGSVPHSLDCAVKPRNDGNRKGVPSL